MDVKEETCKTGLEPHEKDGWRLRISGDCTDVINDIKKYLGEYGAKYLERRLIFDEQTPADPMPVLTEQPGALDEPSSDETE